MFDIFQGDMTRSKVILTFTCLKMYIARSGDTSGSRTTLLVLAIVLQKKSSIKIYFLMYFIVLSISYVFRFFDLLFLLFFWRNLSQTLFEAQ